MTELGLSAQILLLLRVLDQLPAPPSLLDKGIQLSNLSTGPAHVTLVEGQLSDFRYNLFT